jgi:hypothetical protein
MQSRERVKTLAGIMTVQHKEERRVTVLDGLEGGLTIPLEAPAVVLFAHRRGSNRYSSRNQFLTTVLNNNRSATLLVDLLTNMIKE